MAISNNTDQPLRRTTYLATAGRTLPREPTSRPHRRYGDKNAEWKVYPKYLVKIRASKYAEITATTRRNSSKTKTISIETPPSPPNGCTSNNKYDPE
jgi:hypothetical protein